jgi:hypothetical protein
MIIYQPNAINGSIYRIDNTKKALIINIFFICGLYGTNLEPFSDGLEAPGKLIRDNSLKIITNLPCIRES